MELLTHPVVMVSLAVLVANDHWAKQAYANYLTGKLSDATGSLLLAALLALAWAGVVARRAAGTPRAAVVTPVAAAVAAGTVVAGVAVAKTSAAGASATAWVLGAARWPAQVAAAAIGGGLPGPVQPVAVVVDAGDVLAALFALVLVAIVRTTRASPSPTGAGCRS